MERLCTFFAILNCLTVLKPSVIIASWATSGLFPFTGEPPQSKESSETLLREMYACDELGVPPEPPDENTVFLTGVVNTDEAIERFKLLLAQKKKLKPRRYKGQYKYHNSQGTTTSRIDVLNDNEDVGDYAQLLQNDDPSSNVIYGITDACCYVRKHRKRNKVFYSHHGNKLPVWKPRRKRILAR